MKHTFTYVLVYKLRQIWKMLMAAFKKYCRMMNDIILKNTAIKLYNPE